MFRPSPLRKQMETYRLAEREALTAQSVGSSRPGAATGRLEADEEIEFLAWGVTDERGEPDGEILAVLSGVEIEYAALRRGAGIVDLPNRGTLLVTGDEGKAFLDRMLTAPLANLADGTAQAAFWLNRKGRIDADLVVVAAGGRLFLDVDVHQAGPTAESLSRFLIMEEVHVEDVSAEWHRLAVHGPRALDVLAAASGRDDVALDAGGAAEFVIAGATVVAARIDRTGTPGIDLFVEIAAVEAVWLALLAADETVGEGRRRVRPVGWYAYNIARIEAGTPLFNIDFGPTSIPHESGVVHDRVSFKKGCYLGQEVVARVENLGKPKQTLTGFRVRGAGLPIAGGQVFAAASDGPETPIGVVTSSTLSPMLGATPIGFAMVRTEHVVDGGIVKINAEGEQVEAELGPLRAWPPAGETSEANEATP